MFHCRVTNQVQALGCCAGLSPTEGAVGLDKSSGAALSEQAPGFMCWFENFQTPTFKYTIQYKKNRSVA